MKKILFISILSAVFLIGGTSVSMAHCGNCGANAGHSEAKICTKCAEAGKPCMCKKAHKKDCADKKHCPKCAEKAKDKPCKVCKESERKYHKKKKSREIFFNE